MTKTHRLFASLALLALGALASVIGTSVHNASADQSFYAPSQMDQAKVACNFELATTQKVTISATSAATPSVTGRGSVWLTCTVDAFMRQAAYGATGVTATSGNGVFLPMYTPWQMYSRGSLFGFIRASTETCPEAGCFCQVAECM